MAEYKNALVSPVPEPKAIDPAELNQARRQANPERGLFAKDLSEKYALGWAATAITAFHLAYAWSGFNWLILVYLFGLAQIARLRSGRMAFYLGLGVGLCIAAPQLLCFWTIFQAPAIVLWLIIAFWTALFVFLASAALNNLGVVKGGLLMPVLWTGLEYFRSELYYLKFSWLNVGYSLADSPALPINHWAGMYGAGFLGMAAVVWISMLPFRRAALLTVRLGLLLVLALFFHAYLILGQPEATNGKSVRVAGVQLEFPATFEVVNALDNVLKAEPKADILVLSEYTFDGPIPEQVRQWCGKSGRYLVAGGKEDAPGKNFYDTAFVIGPNGEVVFKQVKSVPIQFFKDGLPAREQQLWHSPWGEIGICICYDLSYTRVVDRLVRLGAQALIIPTMDVTDWGRHQHELHARVAPVRAAEYGIPIFRVASSGISQLLDRHGRTMAKGTFPGQGDVAGGRLSLASRGTLPLDRLLAPLCSLVAGVFIVWLLVRTYRGTRRERVETRA